MRRLVPIFTSILIGAIAVALGMGLYLHRANQDREMLAASVTRAERDAKTAQEKQDQAIRDANQKLAAANTEVAKAQAALQTLQEERDAIASAVALTTPRASLLRGWREVVDLSLGATIKYPPTSEVENSDAQSLTLSRSILPSEIVPAADRRWLSLTPWDTQQEQEMTTNFTTSTPVSYLVHGHLLLGHIGTLQDSVQRIFVLRVRTGTKQFLIWARDPDLLPDHKTLLQALSTLDLQS